MTLRKKRRRVAASSDEEAEAGLEQLLELAGSSQRIVVFSGSGLSASSGMSTFSTRGGLYERAQRKYKLADGKSLFTYAFFDRQRPEAQAFFADIYSEAVAAEPAVGHHALRQLHDAGRLLRHYTLNIDGLAEQVGMDTWHHERNTSGVTVEMHGNVRHLVCPECHATRPMTAALAKQIRSKVAVPCGAPGCSHDAMRFKVMMYDDGEAECITPDDVMELMEEDVKAADLVLWVGISFQQSASTVYFRKVRCWIQEAGRLGVTVQALINPSDEALFNLRTAMSNQHELRVLEVLAESDEVLPLLADRLRRSRAAGSGGRAAAAGRQQAAEAAAAAANGVKHEGGWQEEAQQGAPPAAQHPQHARQGQHAAGPAVDALLQHAAGMPGGAGQLGWQEPQVTVKQLEVLQAALTKAMLLATGGAGVQPAAAQQPWQLPPPPQHLFPPVPAAQAVQVQAAAATFAAAQLQHTAQAQHTAAPLGLGAGLPPHHRPQQQQDQQQQQQAAELQGTLMAAAQDDKLSPAAAAKSVFVAAAAAAAAAAASKLQGGSGVKREGSPRAVLMQEQSSHDSDPQPLLAQQAAPVQQEGATDAAAATT